MALTPIYSPRYDIRAGGIEKLHPFDACKYSRAWALAPELHAAAQIVAGPIDDAALRRVHKSDYLQSLRKPGILAQALELPPVALLPAALTERLVLTPMRYATAGTLLGARAALAHGLAFNLSGGYHHARPDRGEGFCLYNDIAVAIAALRADGTLPEETQIVYIDLDAHQGNGVAHCFRADRRVWIFDMFNAAIYPRHDTNARSRVDEAIALAPGTDGATYHAILAERLPGFLDTVGPIGLAIVNAGTDVFVGDTLGGLALTADDVLARDRFVVGALRDRALPTLVLPSGGYSDASHRLIAASLRALHADEAGRG